MLAEIFIEPPKEGVYWYLGLRDPVTKILLPIFCNALEVGLPNSRWQMQDRKRGHAEQVFKQDFFAITLLVIVAVMLKVLMYMYMYFEDMVW